MFALANQTRFTLTVEGSSEKLDVLEFKGREAISQPYRFDLELLSETPDIKLEDLLNRQAFLAFDAGSGIHGQIFRVAQGDSGRRLTRYQVSLVPRLAYLDRRVNQRIFQCKNVPGIIEEVFKDHGILRDAFEFHLGSEYPEREYCVQYGETDLSFVQRLCAEVGIHYHFQHSQSGHLLMFGDDQAFFPKLSKPVIYQPGSGMAAETPAIHRFAVQLETRTTAVVLRDYDFNKPSLLLESVSDNRQLPALKDYHFPGQFTDREYGKQLARRALERRNVDARQARGASDQAALVSGHFLQLADHPRDDWNAQWLLTDIEHHGRQPQVLEEMASSEGGFQGYRNTFVATPCDIPFRPPLLEKPHVAGYQPAIVTGPTDSEIHCDEYGRVKVQMLWDRDGKKDEHSSCWLRVATGWAHDRYGSVLIPRVGMEVLVGFLDADADKPLVMGCLPNAATPVPLNLPADKTRSIFRSQSSPGGGGYNELSIEDRKGAEEIFLRAQRNLTQQVLNDLHVQVGSQRSVVIGGTGSEVSRDSLQVYGDRSVTLNNQVVNASGQFHVSAGQQVVIDGGASATIQAGGHWINIGPGGIFSSVPIVVGGAPMPAMGAPAASRAPLAVLSVAQIQSLQSAAPFCEECQRCKEGVCAA